MYLVQIRMPGESYRRRLGSLLLCLCDVCRALPRLFLLGEKNLDHEPAYTPPPLPWFFYHMVISGYLEHQSTQFRLSASELLLFVSVVLVLINAPVSYTHLTLPTRR